MKQLSIFILFIAGILLFMQKGVLADIDSPQYKIIQPTIGIDDSDQRLQTTLSSSELKTFFKQGYVIRPHHENNLRTTLSHATLTFDNQPGVAQNVSTVLTVTSQPNTRYQTLIQAQQGLKTIWGDEIDRTNCDSGCTVNVAQPWTHIESTGFGYTLKGDDIAPDFKNISYYRKLPDASLGEDPKTVMLGTFTADTRQSTLIFRLNSDQNQPDGTYQTVVDLFVIPLD